MKVLFFYCHSSKIMSSSSLTTNNKCPGSNSSNTRIIAITSFISIFLIGSILLSQNLSPLISSNSIQQQSLSNNDQPKPQQKITRTVSSPNSKNNILTNPKQIYPDEKQLYNSIRQPEKRSHYPNNANAYLNPSPSSCDQPYGQFFCRSSPSSSKNYNDTKKTSSACCCCCWIPHPMSCVGHFKNASATFLKYHVEKTGFYKSTFPIDKVCPWFDRGFWPRPLPDNFLDLSLEEASKVANEKVCGCPERNSDSSSSRTGIGLMYMWELGRTMKQLRPMPATSRLSSQDKNGTEYRREPDVSATTSQNMNSNNSSSLFSRMRTTTRNAPGGVLVFAGDSITRQIFSRMVHRIRSRECSADAEKRRSAVYELQIHETAVYVATTLGDAFVMAHSCEAGLDFLSTTLSKVRSPQRQRQRQNFSSSSTSSFSSSRHHHKSKHTILFQACFVWDNTPSALLGTVANLHQLKDRVAALVFFPQMWYCGTHAEMFCMSANQSNGATLSVIGTATHYSVPRIVACTNVVRQTFAYFQMKRVQKRRTQMMQLFPYQPQPEKYPWIRSMMLQENDEQQAQAQEVDHENDKKNVVDSKNLSSSSTTEKDISSSSSQSFFWSNVRLYDFGERHRMLAPEQCDVVHGMCMFLPPRKEGMKAAVRSLFGGAMCPSPGYGKCQDMGNYHLLDEILISIKV